MMGRSVALPMPRAWRHSGQGVIEPDALSLLPHHRHLGRHQLPYLSGSDFLWVQRPRYRLFVSGCRGLPYGERARRVVRARRANRRWQTFPEPASRDWGLLGLARIGSLVAHVPRRQEVRLFCPQATGLSIFTQSLCAGPNRELDHTNRPNELRGSAPGIQARSDAAGGLPLAGANAPA
jgi:hypothetical protein